VDGFRFVSVLFQLSRSYGFCFTDWLFEAASEFHGTASSDEAETEVLSIFQLMVSVLSRSTSLPKVVIDLFMHRILQFIVGGPILSEPAEIAMLHYSFILSDSSQVLSILTSWICEFVFTLNFQPIYDHQ